MNPQHSEFFQTIFQCPLCNSIPVEERADFLRDVRYSIKRYGKGDMLVAQGSVYEMLYIVVKGEVVTEMSDEKGEFVKMELIRAPNPLATGFLFATDNISPVTALAKTDCVVILIPKDNVFLLMSKYRDFMKAFLAYISNKVAFLSEKLRLASLRTIRAKLGYYLLKESRGEQEFQLKMSKEELSRLLGVSRPALVNVMMQMADEGLIGVDRRKILIKDRIALQRLF
ncbi:MAG TPA: Crp/Fnr family transcriptional regulator [Porphyromonadaceae bacterium]|jgi:CRP-like cAMP-binding protein|uniref:Crp/Fnr family transcriptional regulator n=1 Tax=Petrimonas TaxID=307628 RepID=UPI000E7DC104|nr:Crp/Fnr family transcriptional regulator [Proteiniphilum sp. UBA5218]MDD3542039.1 Crp/Fnr family transcriptional regulator [Petrimonas sp.]HAC74249.1 Crp/Fnr family transcriptional regulator [Porphyromonadaceae bacterium]HBC39199.1 Crp/Fnr family transcriptional regulator [Porphyromonadaceae bacterium]HBG79112.1 Crp/Fnr family transcriptional regulator [Porphyromonadaceae bacterium]HBK40137.1 Crp/Fnr family transcriptional regulator [Porphyromonadaceae bacterium]